MPNATISLLASRDQRELVDRGARLFGVTRSDIMVNAACDRAQEVILDQTTFYLDADRFKQFHDLLGASPTTNPGLAYLMTLNASWTEGG